MNKRKNIYCFHKKRCCLQLMSKFFCISVIKDCRRNPLEYVNLYGPEHITDRDEGKPQRWRKPYSLTGVCHVIKFSSLAFYWRFSYGQEQEIKALLCFPFRSGFHRINLQVLYVQSYQLLTVQCINSSDFYSFLLFHIKVLTLNANQKKKPIKPQTKTFLETETLMFLIIHVFLHDFR